MSRPGSRRPLAEIIPGVAVQRIAPRRHNADVQDMREAWDDYRQWRAQTAVQLALSGFRRSEMDSGRFASMRPVR